MSSDSRHLPTVNCHTLTRGLKSIDACVFRSQIFSVAYTYSLQQEEKKKKKKRKVPIFLKILCNNKQLNNQVIHLSQCTDKVEVFVLFYFFVCLFFVFTGSDHAGPRI